GIGPGVVTGAVTMSIVFYMAGFTEFVGVAELGIIAGGGILLCCIAAVVVLPAIIHQTDSRRRITAIPEPLDIYGWMKPIFSRPRTVLAVSLIGTLVAAVGL